MTLANKTTFERIHYIYSRNEKRFLTLRKQKFADASPETIWNSMSSNKFNSSPGLNIADLGDYLAFETCSGDCIVGVVTEHFNPSHFDLWFISTVLKNGSIEHKGKASETKGVEAARAVTELFEHKLRNVARVDRWSEGKSDFERNVLFFTSRNAPILSVLPAFPCKSSNYDKVASCFPDMGEELAIRRIIDFVTAVQDVYPPGMKFYLVSDGHVFSDCIHVDDDMVDVYFAKLEAMYQRVKPADFDGIIFRGLNDCFESDERGLVAELLHSVEVEHPIPTRLDEETEINRKVLMLGCDDNADVLRKQIQTPNHPRLYLYRGFNKFMCEDLSQTEFAKSISRKKYKKMISQVAFEMIRRNDAYSNLVELIFPFHIRFSIHAHHNAGPKYGVRLLDPEVCSMSGHNQNEEDRLLHIPTPWHNSVFKMVDSDKFIVSHARLAKELESNPEVEGGWDEEQLLFLYRSV
ncbi:uncharacterized protein CXQ87_002623 [Candidozyma duobushaemuli]|uniref:TauD/TfdA-like domain-containing protein n=1 Tax=Candidozyma duobushaemuli TaxID=1231522 RepID=A0A2V1A9M7_9ASCO|nr:uncharacterized protein CXQ87_002623 [[Candida] duobushaemulonis]PVH14482.1 hypothetical protein CXQ87_002623 [[Candida] duobushaemulonis]